MTESLPPHAPEAEQSLLGAAMQSTQAYTEAAAILSTTDFYTGKHQAIWTAIGAVDDTSDTPIKPITVSEELARRGHLEPVGGASYLHTLIAEAPVTSNIDYLASIVAEKAAARRIIEATQRVTHMAYAGSETGELTGMLETARDTLDAAANGSRRNTGVANPHELATQALELLASPAEPSTPMGLADLDKITGGMKAGQMICVAARPGVGKTVLALNAALNVARRSGSAAFFSLEMPQEELTMRCLANMASIDLTAMHNRDLGEREWEALRKAAEEFQTLNLHVCDQASIGSAGIRSICRDLRRNSGLDLAVVDYLQLTTASDPRIPREQQVSGFSRSLKLLGRELDIPLIAVSQLNRGSEQRADKRPSLADLRESGAIEQDSDKVLLLHHDTKDEVKRDAELEVIVAKNRQGKKDCSVSLSWSPHYSRVGNLSRRLEAV